MTLRVALLDGCIAHYRVPFLAALRAQLSALAVVASSIPAELRPALASADIDTMELRQAWLPRTWRHPAGFSQPEPLEIPTRINRTLTKIRPDVVVTGDMGLRSAAAARYCGSKRVPLVIWARLSEHSERGRSRAQRALRPRIARTAARIIVNGASGKSYVESLGVPADRVRVIPQALSPAAVASVDAVAHPMRPVRLVAVGRVVAGKGIHHLLRVWSGLGSTDWHLTVVGEGEDRQELERFAAAGSLPVVFVGECTPAQVASHLANADFLVHPSLSDEWGQVIAEALASGLPVLGSVYAQAVNELVRDGLNGWSFRPDHDADIARVLDCARRTDAPAWERMSDAARLSACGLQPATVATLFATVLQQANNGPTTARSSAQP